MKKLQVPGLIRTAVVVAALAAASIAVASPATAAPTPTAAGTTDGWIRIAHLSPDTKAVDVRLTALSGGAALYELDNVAYGAVSPYKNMADGVYTISMVPAGSKVTAKPMISSSVKIEQGRTVTVAAYGANKNLTVKVFTDDLTSPAPGQARIRLIQASTVAKSVDVTTTTGVQIADNAKGGTATGYAEVAAGPWTLALKASKIKNSAAVNLANGSVTTLLVLDNASGGLTVKPVLDSAAVGSAPVGGVQTGGGYLAMHHLDGFETVGQSTR
ncbi:DUF4397 domain-containing protein [Glaciihabitans sp. UYNi722]|uniref:DUF4397 domain-containing protein n=1 Tax=Glaciihabitans sp. UYNi722 TaxID=3156344 RepID=UPI00339AC1EE